METTFGMQIVNNRLQKKRRSRLQEKPGSRVLAIGGANDILGMSFLTGLRRNIQ